MNKIKLLKQIIILPNVDKGSWVESYDEKTHGFDILVHPFKLCLSGRPNAGKTLLMHNLFLRIQTSSKPFDTLIVIQPSTSSEHDILDPTIILNDIPDIEGLVNDKLGKTLIIIDDFDLTKISKIQQRNISLLFRYISSHHNISVMLSYQSFFDIPTIIRKCSNYFILYKTNNKDEISLIAKRVGYDKKRFCFLRILKIAMIS
jgi:GTPase SAR1 family protein